MIVDASRSSDVASEQLVAGHSTKESEVAWCRSACRGARLRACASATSMNEGSLARSTYTITGGLGGLGVRACAMLMEGGASAVLLSSRSGFVARQEHGFEVLARSSGASAHAVACDIASALDTSLLAGYRRPVGVLHAAGAGDRGLVVALEAHRMHWMYAPKASGAWHLHHG